MPEVANKEQKIANLRRMAQDFYFYSRHCLKILTKAGGKPSQLVLNDAQRYLHERVEAQLKETGRVRVLILKGRQQGISTYIQGRFRWKLKHSRGRKAYVVAHEQKATNNLFAMTKRYHDNEPDDVRPHVGQSDSHVLWFDKLDCKYETATAGTKEIGRSGTAQYFHGSEYAFWPDAETHWAGIGQVVPSGMDDGDGTEIFIETTGNGINNDFYRRWNQAVAGKGEYIAIFIPWFWEKNYRAKVPADWSRDDVEEELVELYGLDDEQLAWRRNKIDSDFKGDAGKFQQEYPCCDREAFMADKRNLIIPVNVAQKAQKRQMPRSATAIVAGLDVARFGDDSTAIVVRHGRKVLTAKKYDRHDTMEVAGIAVRLLTNNPNIQMLFVDVIGIGAGVVDRLHELGFKERVIGVNFAQRASDEEHYVNKRSECWGEMAEWIKEAQIPEGDEWLADVTSTAYKYDSRSRIKLESKEDVKKLVGKSPDLADALAMTFAEPVILNKPRVPAAGARHVPHDELTGY